MSDTPNMAAAVPVPVRQVYSYNLGEEFKILNSSLKQYPIVALDVEFPGVVHELSKPYHHLQSTEKYTHMKNNVNSCKIIQLGLTLSNGFGKSVVWEFNFAGFDAKVDAHNPCSIQLLKNQGLDLDKNKSEGVSVSEFARLFLESRFGDSARWYSGANRKEEKEEGGGVCKINWVLFHSEFDLGYLIKILTQQDLPELQSHFILLVYMFLGFSVFDVKEIATPLGFHGGLEKIAQNLGISREAGGKAHQAGSDSLLTMQVFLKLGEKFFSGGNSHLMGQFNHKLHGIEEIPNDPRKVDFALWNLRVRMRSGQIDHEEFRQDRGDQFLQPDYNRIPPPFAAVPVPRCSGFPVTGCYLPVVRRFRMVPVRTIVPL